MLSHSKTMSYIGYIRNELRHRGFDDTGSLNSVLNRARSGANRRGAR